MTVQEILWQLADSAVNSLDESSAETAVETAEAAVNAHIVSVLEELKKECRLHYFEDVIDAAISKYKEGGNHER